MKPKTIDKLVKFLPKYKNILSKKGGTFFPSLMITAIIGSVSAVSAQEVIELSGELLLQRGSSERPTGVGEELQSGDILHLQLGGEALVLCHNLDIWPVPEDIPKGVNSGCPDGIREPTLGGTRYRPGGNNPQIPYILYPRMTYLQEARPTFSWNPVAGATNYTVRLFGPGGLEWSEENVSSTKVVYPDDAPTLDWGVRYLVTVEADNSSCSLEDVGGNLGFELLDDDDIQKVKTKVAKVKEISQVENRTEEQLALTLVALYRREDIIAEAIDILDKLEEQYKTALVFRKLGDLYAEAGLNLLAEENYKKASELFASTSDQYALTTTKERLAKIVSKNENREQEPIKNNGCSTFNSQIITPTD